MTWAASWSYRYKTQQCSFGGEITILSRQTWTLKVSVVFHSPQISICLENWILKLMLVGILTRHLIITCYINMNNFVCWKVGKWWYKWNANYSLLRELYPTRIKFLLFWHIFKICTSQQLGNSRIWFWFNHMRTNSASGQNDTWWERLGSFHTTFFLKHKFLSLFPWTFTLLDTIPRF